MIPRLDPHRAHRPSLGHLPIGVAVVLPGQSGASETAVEGFLKGLGMGSGGSSPDHDILPDYLFISNRTLSGPRYSSISPVALSRDGYDSRDDGRRL